MTLFGIKDNFADTRAKYKDLFLFSTDSTIYNIPKKYLRGQKDFSADLWQKIEEFYKKEIKGE